VGERPLDALGGQVRERAGEIEEQLCARRLAPARHARGLPALRQIDEFSHCPFFGSRAFVDEAPRPRDDPCLRGPTSRKQRTGGKVHIGVGRVARYADFRPFYRRILELPIPAAPPPKRHPYDQWSPDARALDLVGDKWTLLIIRDLAAGPRRFVELQRVLPGISTEQLRSRLNRMVADGLLTRQRYREVPPRVDYELTERSRELMPVLGALAQWGYDWTWTAPRPGEDVNVGAIFRLAPGLLEPPPGLAGAVELIVDADGEAPERRYLVTMNGGSVEIAERERDGEPTATVRGSVGAWVRALGPEGDLEELEFDGNRSLADGLLTGFADAARRSAQAA
jgi:DNA-binding HxlR family transcriptional regulator